MKMLSRLTLIAIFGLFASASVSAQWLWTDNDGRRVFSDRPPPPDIPDKNILKRPAARVGTVAEPPDDDAGTGTNPDNAAPQAKKPPSGIDKELEVRKKRAADAEAARQQAEKDKYNQARAENCERAKRAKASYAPGSRIAITNANGEREFLDDAQIAAEARHAQDLIDSECN